MKTCRIYLVLALASMVVSSPAFTQTELSVFATYEAEISENSIPPIRDTTFEYLSALGYRLIEQTGRGQDFETGGISAFANWAYVEADLAFLLSNLGAGLRLRIYVFNIEEKRKSTLDQDAMGLISILGSNQGLEFESI